MRGLTPFAVATAWNAGNIGPALTEISADLDVSLATLGLAGGSFFFAGLVIAKLGAARLTRALEPGGAARAACLCAVGGNALIAISPLVAGVAAGRLLGGISLGLALVLGPVLARQAGGVRLVGLFGAAITVGTAAGLGSGALLRALGVDWRIDFVVAAVIALVPLAALSSPARGEVQAGSVLGLARRSATNLAAWRLELLFMTALGMPYVLGIWLVPYLTRDAGLAVGFAGLLGVTLYLASTVLRPAGARLDARGTSLGLLGGIAPMVAAAGLALIALVDSDAATVVGVLLAAVGFAIPYAAMYDEAVRLFPEARIAAVGLLSVGGNLLPLLVTPVIGSAIASGDGDLAFLLLAAVSLTAGLANLRPAVS